MRLVVLKDQTVNVAHRCGLLLLLLLRAPPVLEDAPAAASNAIHSGQSTRLHPVKFSRYCVPVL